MGLEESTQLLPRFYLLFMIMIMINDYDDDQDNDDGDYDDNTYGVGDVGTSSSFPLLTTKCFRAMLPS